MFFHVRLFIYNEFLAYEKTLEPSSRTRAHFGAFRFCVESSRQVRDEKKLFKGTAW